MSSRSFGVGSHLRFLENPADADPLNDGARRSLDGLGPSQPQLTAEQIKQAFEAAQREDQAHQDRLETQANADAFIVGHPELKDSKPNAHLLLNQARTMFGENCAITVEMWEAAYQHLREKTDFLELDAKEVAKQQADASRQRYADARAAEARRITNLSEDVLETLPLEEIRRLDAIERQKQLQTAGERGGNGW